MSEPKKRFKKTVAETPLAAEYCVPPKNTLPADQVPVWSDEYVWWRCQAFRFKCGVLYLATPNNRHYNGTGCTDCYLRAHPSTTRKAKPKIAVVEVDRLAREYNAARNHPFYAEHVSVADLHMRWWVCYAHGHEWQATPYNRYYNQSNCPECAELLMQSKATEEINLLLYFPRVAKDWDSKNVPSDPSRVHPGDTRKYHWICSESDCGYEVDESPVRRIDRKTHPCPECTARRRKNRIVPEGQSLLERFPELAQEWSEENTLKPDQLAYNSTRKGWWRCSVFRRRCGKKWFTQVRQRTQLNSGCPSCANLVIAETLLARGAQKRAQRAVEKAEQKRRQQQTS